MPQIQTFNFDKPREPTNLERTLQSFSQQNVVNQERKQEGDALADIYKQYQGDGENLQKRIEAIQTDSRIGPTARVNAVDQLLKYQQYNNTLQEKAAKQLKEQESIQANDRILADLEQKRNLQPGSLSAYRNDPKMAETVTRPPKSAGGLGGIPMSPEEGQTYERVLKENPDATADELSVAFSRSGLAPGRYSGAVETRRRIDETKAKNDVESKKISRKEEVQFHKESEKYDEELNKAVKGAKNQLEAIEDVRQALDRGGDTRKSLANVFKGFGEVGGKLSNALISKDQAVIQASIPAFLEGRKELFGVRLSDADLALLQDKLPDIGKSPEANRAILNIMERYSKKSILRGKIAADIKKKNKGLRPLGYTDEIEERLDDMTKPVKIMNPNTGNIIEIPAYEASAFIEDGGMLVNE
jgi:hypothetical protein